MGNDTDETFFSRWSRRKSQVRQEAAPPAPPDAEAEQPPPAAAATVLATAPVAAAEVAETVERPKAEGPSAARSMPPPTLEEAMNLTPASDFSRFVAPGVDSGVKNTAMKKLFTDPHFNTMDGLDTYIEDYGRADPIPKAMLRQMVQARMLGLLDDEMEEQPVPAGAVAPAGLGPGGDVEPIPLAPEATDPLESVPETVRIEAAHDGAVPAPAPPAAERTAGLPEPPVA